VKHARWGVAQAFATVGGPWGAVVAHVFVDDSSAPICQPHVTGIPGELFGAAGAHHCHVCWDRLIHPTWSVTSYGKRLLWTASSGLREHAEVAYAAYRDGARLHQIDRPCAWGIVSTEAEAFAQARAAIAARLPADAPVEIRRASEADAIKVAREQRAEARAKKVSDGTDAQIVEYVCRHYKKYTSWFSSTFEWETERYKVLRKTPKRLFVENTIATYKTASGATVLHTYALDRAKLEQGKHPWGWTLDPNPPFDSTTGKRAIPGWADVLGLSIPCTLADAKRAFRASAKKAHPDHGGTPEAFQRVKQAFDAATQHLSRGS
jgi:hypothetical protein